MTKLMLSLGLVAALQPLGDPPAAATVCAAGPVLEMLADAEGALVGTVLSVHGTGSTIAVEDDLLDNLPDVVVVHDDVGLSSGGESEAFSPAVGSRVGVVPYRKDGRWQANQCSTVSPERLLAAVGAFPQPNGEGRLAFVLAVDMMKVTTIGLDALGRPLAYGTGGGTAIALCPNGRVLVEASAEAVEDGGQRSIRVVARDLVSFEPHHIGAFTIDEEFASADPAQTITCLDDEGAAVAVALSPPAGGPTGRAMLWTLTGDRPKVLFDEDARALTLTEDTGLVATRSGTLLEIMFASGEQRIAGTLEPGVVSMAADPAGGAVAVLREAVSSPKERSSGLILEVIELRDASVRASTTIPPDAGNLVSEALSWGPGTSILRHRARGAERYDLDLRLIRSWQVGSWYAGADGEAYGLIPSLDMSTLVRADGGTLQAVTEFPGSVPSSMLVVPPDIDVMTRHRPAPEPAASIVPDTSPPWAALSALALVAVLGVARAVRHRRPRRI